MSYIKIAGNDPATQHVGGDVFLCDSAELVGGIHIVGLLCLLFRKTDCEQLLVSAIRITMVQTRSALGVLRI